MIQYFSFSIIALFLCVSQLVVSPADFQDSETFTKEQIAEVDALIKAVGKKELKALDGAKLYKQNCSSCHGRKGGLGIGGAANLKTSTLDTSHKFAMIYYGKGKMTSYKSALKPAEILSLSNYLDSLRG